MKLEIAAAQLPSASKATMSPEVITHFRRSGEIFRSPKRHSRFGALKASIFESRFASRAVAGAITNHSERIGIRSRAAHTLRNHTSEARQAEKFLRKVETVK